jgi:hypothetical protein
MAWTFPVKCLIGFTSKIDRFTRAIPFSDFPVIEDLFKSLRVVPTLLYMTIAPQVFYSRIHRYAKGKSLIVPPPATFATSVAVLFIIGLFKSENVARAVLALAFITASIWVYSIIIITYVIIFLERPLLHYLIIFQPFWRGPELSVMFSPSAIARIDRKLLTRAFMFLATQCFLAIPIAFMLPVGTMILARWIRPDLYPYHLPAGFWRGFEGALYCSAILLSWLVARPAAYLFVYCLRIPTAQVLRITIFRKLLDTMEANDNFRFVSDPATHPASQKARSEWDQAVVQLRNQERKIRALSPRAHSEYLTMRSEVFLVPLYRCLDDEKDKGRLTSLRTVTEGRSLLSN